MADINSSISIISLNVNSINSLIKRQRLVVWIKQQTKQTKTMSKVYAFKKTHFKFHVICKLNFKKGKVHHAKPVKKKKKKLEWLH